MMLSLPATAAGREEGKRASGHRVALFLFALALAGAALPFVGFSPNRILSAAPVYLWQIEPLWVPATLGTAGVVTVVGLFLPAPWSHAAIGIAALAALIAAVAGAGAVASGEMASAASPGARVSLGAGFWLIVVATALAASESSRRLRTPALWRGLVVCVAIAFIAWLAANGWFDDLSLVHEWANRRDAYARAFTEHVGLVATSLVVALLLGVPLGIAAALRPRIAPSTFGALNLVQTIPSIALFGLLIGPLAALSASVPVLRAIGVSGIGFAPAVIALVLYALLPVARNTEAAIRSVPEPTLDAARGMGMTARQILLNVTLPLASPILLAGLRVVVVQLIGLAVVAALIGAGGFGSFVFLGLGQTATDLVLLGALSAIALAIVADGALRIFAGYVRAQVMQ
jgi:osmoprotectant transport system permease protein